MPQQPQLNIAGFNLSSCRIKITRAVHDDTDYAAFGLTVNGASLQPLVKKIGNVDNGLHTIGLSFSLQDINPDDQIVLSYLLINHGGGKTDDILARCSTAVLTSPLRDFDPAAAQYIYQPPYLLPACLAGGWMRGPDDIHALWDPIKSIFAHSGSDHCDGPVAIDRFSFYGSALPVITDLIAQLGYFGITYAGIDSADGCGRNSLYSVQWTGYQYLGPIIPLAPLSVRGR
jgi:hypothetical protein